jgi:glutathione S-transferase
LEDADADYIEVARLPKRGMTAMMRFLESRSVEHRPFAPPFLKAGKVLIAQTANILLFLGPRLRLAPRDDASRLWANQLQLTIADWVAEVHDTHHPISGSLYYEEQKREAKRRAADFRDNRLPKFLDYFEQILKRSAKGGYLVSKAVSYVDLSMFQMIAGLRYAFPRAMARLEPKIPRLVELHDRVSARPRLAAYLASPRRLPFNQEGLFRHYPELDG